MAARITRSTKHSGVRFEWRGTFANTELNELHSECFQHPLTDDDWWSRLNTFSLGWICMRMSKRLVGFVNVAWDGGVHAFLLDTMITTDLRRRGYATALVEEAVKHARALRCEWLHVDFEPHLRDFYYGACKFKATDAGLIRLR
ncbi:GNAT family N-acetyltransferase [Neorhizobium sp. Rsf11]|uniref:GNAT family N-acetyltransferase n=1 Tax=Neorhizobium phenanthreniclasticum TaxID=3157917 RepID=A0ABV0M938_9HYPH